MPRSYLVGWGYAFKAFYKSYRKSKIQRKIWRKLVHKKYYWLTTEERVESHKKCLDALGELGKNMFPNGIPFDDYDYSEMNDYDEEIKTNKEIILDYCDNIQTGDIDHLQGCINVRNALRNTELGYKELLNRLDGSCPSSVGLDDHVVLCYETINDNLSNDEKYDQCKRCWAKVLA